MARGPIDQALSWVELGKYASDPMGYLTRMAERGGKVILFHLGSLPCYMVNDLDYIKTALHSHAWPPITRGRMDFIRDWYEGGLATYTGELHNKHRDQMWLPVMTDPWLLETAVSEADEWQKSWKEGGSIEAYEELRKMTYAICWRVLTGERLADRPGIYDTLAAGDMWLGILVGPFGRMRWRLPTPEGIKGRNDSRKLNEVVDSLVAQRKGKANGQDLLSRFVKVGDAELNANAADYRGTIKAYFGAENLHTHMAWTFYLLSQNPEQEAKLHEELDRVLGGRLPTVADFENLDYTRRVTKESLRLYPSVPAFFRGIEGDFKLGDDVIPAGSLMGFAPWVIHRDARFWKDPMKFDPDRWLPDAPKPPHYAYLPFAAGDYRCPGTAKSLKEGPLVLATLAQKWTMRQPANTPPPIAAATWSLQAKRGIPMITKRRV
jgi:cytochrome P450